MENASKALIMAGGILIGVVILSIFIFTYGNVSRLQGEKLTQEEVEQLAVFNTVYESYNKKLLRGVDVISVINRAISNNTKYENDAYYNIEVEFQIKEGSSTLPAGTYNIGYYASSVKSNSTVFTELKRKIFDCTELKYSDDSGRVNYMKFVERIVE